MAQLKVSQLKPQPGYILVEPAQQENKTESGIYLPDTHDEKPQHGTVKAVGGKTTTEYGATLETNIKKGDEVLYKKWGGNEVKIKDIEYQFLKFEDVLAVVK